MLLLVFVVCVSTSRLFLDAFFEQVLVNIRPGGLIEYLALTSFIRILAKVKSGITL